MPVGPRASICGRQLPAQVSPLTCDTSKGPTLAFLFRRLTAEPERGAKLFAALTAEARQPHWYVEGTVPDTLDGRFAVLATIVALALVRIEQAGDAANALSVALTERFIEVMESEHRELGLGDPTLGKTVRKLVGSLARRVDLWRNAATGEIGWMDATHDSLYRGRASPEALAHSSGELERLWKRLERTGRDLLGDGRLA